MILRKTNSLISVIFAIGVGTVQAANIPVIVEVENGKLTSMHRDDGTYLKTPTLVVTTGTFPDNTLGVTFSLENANLKHPARNEVLIGQVRVVPKQSDQVRIMCVQDNTSVAELNHNPADYGLILGLCSLKFKQYVDVQEFQKKIDDYFEFESNLTILKAWSVQKNETFFEGAVHASILGKELEKYRDGHEVLKRHMRDNAIATRKAQNIAKELIGRDLCQRDGLPFQSLQTYGVNQHLDRSAGVIKVQNGKFLKHLVVSLDCSSLKPIEEGLKKCSDNRKVTVYEDIRKELIQKAQTSLFDLSIDGNSALQHDLVETIAVEKSYKCPTGQEEIKVPYTPQTSVKANFKIFFKGENI